MCSLKHLLHITSYLSIHLFFIPLISRPKKTAKRAKELQVLTFAGELAVSRTSISYLRIYHLQNWRRWLCANKSYNLVGRKLQFVPGKTTTLFYMGSCYVFSRTKKVWFLNINCYFSYLSSLWMLNCVSFCFSTTFQTAVVQINFSVVFIILILSFESFSSVKFYQIETNNIYTYLSFGPKNSTCILITHSGSF